MAYRTIRQIELATGGVNIEKTARISKQAQDSIQKQQQDTKKELENAVPAVSMSDQLAEIKMSDLDLSKIEVPYGVNLSGISIKDLINLNKVNLAKTDLSELKDDDLDHSVLKSLGFSAFSFTVFTATAIIGLVKLIKDKVKSTNTTTIEKRRSLSVVTPTQTNVAGSDQTKYNNLDQYAKKRRDVKKKVNNSPFSVDQRSRTDILNSTVAVSTKKRTILYKDNPNYGRYFNSFNI